jgi:hypothetical protein
MEEVRRARRGSHGGTEGTEGRGSHGGAEGTEGGHTEGMEGSCAEVVGFGSFLKALI